MLKHCSDRMTIVGCKGRNVQRWTVFQLRDAPLASSLQRRSPFPFAQNVSCFLPPDNGAGDSVSSQEVLDLFHGGLGLGLGLGNTGRLTAERRVRRNQRARIRWYHFSALKVRLCDPECLCTFECKQAAEWPPVVSDEGTFVIQIKY